MSIAHELDNKWRSADTNVDRKYTFSSILNNESILDGLNFAGFQTPSPVQMLAIPPACTGKDLIIQSKSGTGKTLVFIITALEHINIANSNLQVLIIVPMPEIALQVQQVLCGIAKYFPNLKCEVFFSSFSFPETIKKLNNCHIAVGTPGNLKFLIEAGKLITNSIDLIILDEADLLLDSIFLQETKYIINHLPNRRQMLALSAAFSNIDISTLLKYMSNAKVIRVYENELALKGVVQFFHLLEDGSNEYIFNQKCEMMLNILDSISFSQCIIFSPAHEVSLLYQDLQRRGHAVGSINKDDDSLYTRLQTIEEFRNFQMKILITTSSAAPGVDIENVDLVLNMNPGINMANYLNRIGRAGRYGSKGVAISLVTKGYALKRLTYYMMEGDFSVYPLPNPVPCDLKNYAPPSPELGDCLPFIISNSKPAKEVMKELQNCSKEKNYKKNGLESQTDSSFEHGAVYGTEKIASFSAENVKMPLNNNKFIAKKIREKTISDLKRDDLANEVALPSDTLNTFSILSPGNDDAVCNSGISLLASKNAEFEAIGTKKVGIKLSVNIPNDKMKGTDSYGGVRKKRLQNEKPVEMDAKNKTNKKIAKQLNYRNGGFGSNSVENRKSQRIRKSDQKEISDEAIKSLNADKKRSEENCYSSNSSLCELFEKWNHIKVENTDLGKKVSSKDMFPKQKQGIQSDRRINTKEVNKLLANKPYKDKHRKIEHQSNDSCFCTSNIHKEKRCMTASSKALKKTDIHSVDNTFHDDSEFDCHCTFQYSRQQQHRRLTRKDNCGHCNLNCGRNSHSLVCVPWKCDICHDCPCDLCHDCPCRLQCCNNRCACYKSYTVPFPLLPLIDPHGKYIDFNLYRHQALMLILSATRCFSRK